MEYILKRYVVENISKKYGLNKLELTRYLDIKTRGRPKKSKSMVSSIHGEDLIARLISEAKIELNIEKHEDEEEEEEEEEIVVKRFHYKGSMYLRSRDNKIYSNETHEEIGIWNELNGEIELE